MSIEIERKNGYWEANTPNEKGLPYRSVDGVAWVQQLGTKPSNTRLEELRAAFFNHLDTTTEPQRAKVGDWIKIHTTHFYNPLHNKEAEVRRVYPDGDAWVDGVKGSRYEDSGVCVSPCYYTIVPDPTPEREVFTGDPSTWGEGWYREVGGKEVVFVDCSGEWAAVLVVGDMGGVRGSMSNGTMFKNKQNFHRISDNPADGVKWEGGEG